MSTMLQVTKKVSRQRLRTIRSASRQPIARAVAMAPASSPRISARFGESQVAHA